MRDLFSEVRCVSSLVPAARVNGTVNGTTVDRAGTREYYQDALIVVPTGVITDGTHTIEVQDSPDGATWTAVTDQLLQATEPAIVAADDNKTFEIGYQGTQRFLRVVATTAGATTGGVFGALVVLGGGRSKPPVRS